MRESLALDSEASDTTSGPSATRGVRVVAMRRHEQPEP